MKKKINVIIAIIGLVASCVGIYTFVSGNVTLASIFSQSQQSNVASRSTQGSSDSSSTNNSSRSSSPDSNNGNNGSSNTNSSSGNSSTSSNDGGSNSSNTGNIGGNSGAGGNLPGNANSSGTGSSGSQTTTEGLRVAPTSFTVIRDTSTAGCSYFPHHGWECSVNLYNTTSDQLDWTGTVPDGSSIAIQPSSTGFIFAHDTWSPSISIPDMSCPASAAITFAVNGGASVHVQWQCTG